MKAVIVEVDGKNAVVLSRNGEFVKIKNHGKLVIGHEIELPKAKVFTFNTYVKAASIAAVFLLLSGVSFGAYCYSLPYSYVDVDINPSIEFTTNRFDRIIDVKALNEDGNKLLSQSSYKNIGIKDGIQNVLKSASSQGYIKGDGRDAVMVTVSGKDDKKVEEIEQEVRQAARDTLHDTEENSKVMVDKTSLERRNEAQKIGLSPGKFKLIEQLVVINPELKVEDLKKQSVKNIMKQINTAKKESKQEDKQQKKQDDSEVSAITQSDQDSDSVQNEENRKQDKTVGQKSGNKHLGKSDKADDKKSEGSISRHNSKEKKQESTRNKNQSIEKKDVGSEAGDKIVEEKYDTENIKEHKGKSKNKDDYSDDENEKGDKK